MGGLLRYLMEATPLTCCQRVGLYVLCTPGHKSRPFGYDPFCNN